MGHWTQASSLKALRGTLAQIYKKQYQNNIQIFVQKSYKTQYGKLGFRINCKTSSNPQTWAYTKHVF